MTDAKQRERADAANARARMLERRADATQAENEALVALLEAAEAREKELEAKQRIDEQQCDEMTDRAGRYLQRAEAAEARAKELEGANELRSELLWKQTRRVGELTEALGDVLEARRQFGCLSSGAAEHRLHLAAEKAQDVLAGLDGGEDAHTGEHDWYGAYCLRCGADEASSWATEPCGGEK